MKPTLSITLISEENTLTFDELCRAIHAEQDLMIQLIDYHIIQPKGKSQQEWLFDHIALKRARLARNFYYDLEVNLAGIGLLIDLMEQIERLKQSLRK